jgi:hypothetical protein
MSQRRQSRFVEAGLQFTLSLEGPGFPLFSEFSVLSVLKKPSANFEVWTIDLQFQQIARLA